MDEQEMKRLESKTAIDYLKDDLLYFAVYIAVSLVFRWTLRLIFGFEEE